jgi:TM2 domain-containing membrane protein YozV
MDNRPYVFISYAHANSESVLPCIEALRRKGVNVWFDEGIVAGSEWPEFIAEKVVTCTKFVLFVSNAYLASQNCKRELNFAISRKKEILSIYIEDVALSPGMEMQLGTYQAIYKSRFPSDKAFYDSLCAEPFMASCTFEPDENYTIGNNYGNHGGTNNYGGTNQGGTNNYGGNNPGGTNNYGGNGNNQNGANNGYTYDQRFDPLYGQAQHNPFGNMFNSALPVKSRVVAAFLAFFLGTFGVHKFYLGKKGWGVLYILFCWTYIPTFLGVLGFIRLLFMSDYKFERKYKCRTR